MPPASLYLPVCVPVDQIEELDNALTGEVFGGDEGSVALLRFPSILKSAREIRIVFRIADDIWLVHWYMSRRDDRIFIEFPDAEKRIIKRIAIGLAPGNQHCYAEAPEDAGLLPVALFHV